MTLEWYMSANLHIRMTIISTFAIMNISIKVFTIIMYEHIVQDQNATFKINKSRMILTRMIDII